jgi:hypothetical protein
MRKFGDRHWVRGFFFRAERRRMRHIERVEKTVRVFKSFAKAEAAEDEFYASLAPEARLAMVFELVAQAHPDEIKRRSKRVCRVVKRKGR